MPNSNLISNAKPENHSPSPNIKALHLSSSLRIDQPSNRSTFQALHYPKVQLQCSPRSAGWRAITINVYFALVLPRLRLLTHFHSALHGPSPGQVQQYVLPFHYRICHLIQSYQVLRALGWYLKCQYLAQWLMLGWRADMSTNRFKYFRWTARTARISFIYMVFIPSLVGYMAYHTDVSASSACARNICGRRFAIVAVEDGKARCVGHC